MFKAAKYKIIYPIFYESSFRKKRVFPLQNNTLQYIASIQDIRVKKKSLMWQAK